MRALLLLLVAATALMPTARAYTDHSLSVQVALNADGSAHVR